MTKKQQSKIKKFLSARNHGFLRVAVIVPRVHLADTKKNAEEHLRELRKVYKEGAAYAVCPELGLTGYSNNDLFFSDVLVDGAKKALKELLQKTRSWKIAITVGLPLVIDQKLCNAAATFTRGKILAITLKSYPPEYREFHELRHFAPAREIKSKSTEIFEQEALVG